MIRALDGLPDGVLGFEASGRITQDDYTGVLQPALSAAADEGRLRVVLVFPEGFDGMEASAVWEDLKVGIGEWRSWERIALVTDVEWIRDGLRLFSWAMPGEARAFALAERDEAIAWAASTG